MLDAAEEAVNTFLSPLLQLYQLQPLNERIATFDVGLEGLDEELGVFTLFLGETLTSYPVPGIFRHGTSKLVQNKPLALTGVCDGVEPVKVEVYEPCATPRVKLVLIFVKAKLWQGDFKSRDGIL